MGVWISCRYWASLLIFVSWSDGDKLYVWVVEKTADIVLLLLTFVRWKDDAQTGLSMFQISYVEVQKTPFQPRWRQGWLTNLYLVKFCRFERIYKILWSSKMSLRYLYQIFMPLCTSAQGFFIIRILKIGLQNV